MAENHSVKLHWLEQKPSLPGGVTWGVPWPKGALQRAETLTMGDACGNQIPLQSWPTAYWPDGSVKWTAHAACFAANPYANYWISKGDPVVSAATVNITETAVLLEIETPKLSCSFNKTGPVIIREMKLAGRTVCSGGKLVGLREEISYDQNAKLTREEALTSTISKVMVENSGPLRVVVKVEGKHSALSNGREWLPFTLRFYFYAGSSSVRIIHTFVYDGDPQKDFLKGLGFQFDLPVSGELYNRRICLAGDTGFFAESVQFLARGCSKYRDLYPLQVNGGILTPETAGATGPELVQDMAVWNDFKLVQDSAEQYLIRKRTKPDCCWIDAAQGRHSGGLALISGDQGGLAAGVRNFWQKYPSGLEITNASHPKAELTVWFWSPDGGAMDLRHYDTETHTVSSYEGAVELRSTPQGIANTSEVCLFAFESRPTATELWEAVRELQAPPLLVCDPEYYHDLKAFGIWSLPDRSTPAKAWLEEKLEALTDFYRNEIEQRYWYGFWNYGDLMHTYDPVRHTWKYDTGGYAWQNTELVPNFWLWYSFLRTGKPELFRMAEAMTRHTSEVDLYHLGAYTGLGSRHNVIHWGCGCKEARIGMAGLHRFYYYLTGDERVGEIMDEVKDADYQTVTLDPMRAYFPKDQFPTHIRTGPDWAAFASNWLTRWERYEDRFYLEKLLEGIKSLKAMPFRLLSGPTFGYQPETGKLYYLGDENYSYHMVISFGAPQVWMELAQLLEDREWEEMLAEFGAFYNLSPEAKTGRTGGKITGRDWSWPVFSGGMVALAARFYNDPELAVTAWRVMLDAKTQPIAEPGPLETELADGPGIIGRVREIPWLSTNTASMWSLGIMICLELIGDYLEEAMLKSGVED